MNMNKIAIATLRFAAAAALVSSLAACADLSRQQAHAGVGAAAGGALGYLVTGGPIGTVVGAAAGGLIGAGVRGSCADSRPDAQTAFDSRSRAIFASS